MFTKNIKVPIHARHVKKCISIFHAPDALESAVQELYPNTTVEIIELEDHFIVLLDDKSIFKLKKNWTNKFKKQTGYDFNELIHRARHRKGVGEIKIKLKSITKKQWKKLK